MNAGQPSEIHGIYAANITPLRPAGGVHVGHYLAHAAWLLERGVRGLVPFGTNGEGPSFSTREKLAVLGELMRAFPGTPIIPAVMEGSLSASLELIEGLRGQPVQALLVLPPYYYRPAAAAELGAFYRQIVERSPVPVIAYHIPKYAVPVPLEVLREPGLWGVKESEGNPAYAASVRALGLGVLLGTEDDLPAGLERGAAGAISALCNVAPEGMAACYAAVRAAAAHSTAPQTQATGATEVQRRSAALQQLRALTKTLPTVALLKRLAGERQQLDFGDPRLPLPPLPGDADLSAVWAGIRAACS